MNLYRNIPREKLVEELNQTKQCVVELKDYIVKLKSKKSFWNIFRRKQLETESEPEQEAVEQEVEISAKDKILNAIYGTPNWNRIATSPNKYESIINHKEIMVEIYANGDTDIFINSLKISPLTKDEGITLKEYLESSCRSSKNQAVIAVANLLQEE
jgi:hypothetical protein